MQFGCWERFRRYGIRPAKSIFASAVDVGTDWYFFYRVSKDASLDEYHTPLLVVCGVSSFMGILLLISLLYTLRVAHFKQQERVQALQRRIDPSRRFLTLSILKNRPTSWIGWIKLILGLEIILEDIPQFVLSSLVSAEYGALSTAAIINIGASAFNLVLNLLDMLEIEAEDGLDEATSSSDSYYRREI